MMSLRKITFIAALLSALASAPVRGEEGVEGGEGGSGRPYRSEDPSIESVLQRYWDEAGRDNPKCGKGKSIGLSNSRSKVKYTVSVDTFCFGGGDPTYRMRLVRRANGVTQTFLDALLDGKLDNSSMFSSISDKYFVRTKKGKNEYDFSVPEDISKNDQEYIRKEYDAAKKQVYSMINSEKKNNK